ncbi:hypothetical protein PM082_013043 [Marasmius tenuissimus]|nr:hypothetical protein PM082_013043 [Marasmius tenuissimus]
MYLPVIVYLGYGLHVDSFGRVLEANFVHHPVLTLPKPSLSPRPKALAHVPLYPPRPSSTRSLWTMPSDIPEGRLPWWLIFFDKINLTVTVATALVNVWTGSMGVAYFTAGATCCSLAVKVVKKMVRQPRPVVVMEGSRKVKKSYGMPSTHSAVITFYMSYMFLACSRLPIHPSLPRSSLTRLVPPLICVPWGVAICQSRVWLGHHDWAQVLAGCAFGVAFSTAWFMAWVGGLNEHGQVAERYLHSYIPWFSS